MASGLSLVLARITVPRWFWPVRKNHRIKTADGTRYVVDSRGGLHRVWSGK